MLGFPHRNYDSELGAAAKRKAVTKAVPKKAVKKSGWNRPAKTSGDDVSMFSFQVSKISGGGAGLKDIHSKFNSLVSAAFPKLLYNLPFTSYSNPIAYGFYAEGFISASGESKYSPDETKQKLISLLNQAGFNFDPSTAVAGALHFDQQTVGQLKAGANVQSPKPIIPLKNTNKKKTSNKSSSNTDWSLSDLPDLGDGNFLDKLGLGLGLSTPVVALAAALILFAVIKK